MRRTVTRYRNSLSSAYMDCITVLERPNPNPHPALGGPHFQPARPRAKPDRKGVMRWRLVRYLSRSDWKRTYAMCLAHELSKRLNTPYQHFVYVGGPTDPKVAAAELRPH